MKKFLIALTVLASLGVPTVAHADDSLCFMKTSSGRVVNLGAACGEEESSSSQIDATFLEDYRRTLDDTLALRIASAPTGKDWALRTARNYCDQRRAGVPDSQITRNYAKGIVSVIEGKSDRAVRATQEALATIMVIAPKHYCPEFAGR